MQKAIENFLLGLTFGMGFSVAAGVCHLIAMLLSKAS